MWTFRLPVNPVPASRVRVSHYGNYYKGRYPVFRREAARVVPDAVFDAGIKAPLECYLRVAAAFHVKRPRATKLDYPKGDLDNYEKALYDVLTGYAWDDDDLIVINGSSKHWAPKGEEGWIDVAIQRL